MSGSTNKHSEAAAQKCGMKQNTVTCMVVHATKITGSSSYDRIY
jgi:hypothetical protein